MTEKEKCLRIIRREIAKANDIPWPEEDCPSDQEKWYLEMQMNNRRQKGKNISGVDFKKDMFSEIVLGESKEDQLLFGRSDWRPSVDACLSLIEANVVTVGDLRQVGFYNMETKYGLKNEDVRQLEALLYSLDCPSRRPRVRKRYDDWKRPPKY